MNKVLTDGAHMEPLQFEQDKDRSRSKKTQSRWALNNVTVFGLAVQRFLKPSGTRFTKANQTII